MHRPERRSKVDFQPGFFKHFPGSRVGERFTRIDLALGDGHVAMMLAVHDEDLQFAPRDSPRHSTGRDDRVGVFHFPLPRVFRLVYSVISVS